MKTTAIAIAAFFLGWGLSTKLTRAVLRRVHAQLDPPHQKMLLDATEVAVSSLIEDVFGPIHYAMTEREVQS